VADEATIQTSGLPSLVNERNGDLH
jgi:hypothetical protein